MEEGSALYGVIDKKTGKLAGFAGSKKECDIKIWSKKARIELGECYEDIISVISNYIDIPEERKTLLALWILGTYIHEEFEAYPYLFLNAMRGSAKTRTLKLVTKLSKGGRIMCSPTEATLFRTKGTLGIDEFEDVGKKGKSEVRELLNGAYKKGMKIIRMRRVRTKEGDQQIPEEFETYRPVIMANIWGMEEVLGDRSISVVLEKSQNQIYTKKIEDFEQNPVILAIKKRLTETFKKKDEIQCSLCSVYLANNIHTTWNNWINDKYKYTYSQYTLNTLNTLNSNNNIYNKEDTLKKIELEKLFLKFDNSNIQGRDFELFLPLFLIAYIISDDVLDKIIDIAKSYTNEKKQDMEIESRDIMLLDFISRKQSDFNFYSVKLLTNEFKQFVEWDDDEDRWLNSLWFGRALKRLNLVVEKRRMGRGQEVILNVKKALEKLKMFKTEKEKDEKTDKN